ncbi:MAG: HNH endonuclease [Deltaproteobacteria bacterium]|nr:HNH endonuclease [Deltaproteobacteria bacterium]
MNPSQLHLRALEIVGRYLRTEAELLDVLQEIDRSKAYRAFECPSLFVYAVRELKLSESIAYNFITVARKAVEVPALKAEIARGDLSVSTARKITPVLTARNHEHWIELAKTLPRQMLEREVARVAPKTATPERTAYVSASRLQLTMGVSDELHAKLRRAQDLVSQSQQRPADLEATLEAVLDLFLERRDPVRKVARIRGVPKPVPGQARAHRAGETTGDRIDRRGPMATAGAGRSMTWAVLRRQTLRRDEGRCMHLNSRGHRCNSSRWVDIHHVVPKSHGGEDVLENLVTLCKAHHLHLHRMTAEPH